MRIQEVSGKKLKKAFLQVPGILYKDDATWVCPLDKEIESIFDPGQNVYFKHGEATRWVLYDKESSLIGRIAGFIDRNLASKYDQARGVLMGVIPAFQGLGVEAEIIINLVKVFETKPHYTEIEFSWVADFNPKMRKIFMSVGTVSAKHYITYRYLFDRNAAFKRYPIPDDGKE